MGGKGNLKDHGLQETIKEYIYLMLNHYSHVLGMFLFVFLSRQDYHMASGEMHMYKHCTIT